MFIFPLLSEASFSHFTSHDLCPVKRFKKHYSRKLSYQIFSFPTPSFLQGMFCSAPITSSTSSHGVCKHCRFPASLGQHFPPQNGLSEISPCSECCRFFSLSLGWVFVQSEAPFCCSISPSKSTARFSCSPKVPQFSLVGFLQLLSIFCKMISPCIVALRTPFLSLPFSFI